MLKPDEIRAFASSSGIHAVGWFAASEFPLYLDVIRQTSEYHGMVYRPLEAFLRAGRVAEGIRSVIVLVMDYFVDSSDAPAGLRLSNYSRACWSTVNPKIAATAAFLRAKGFRAENLDLPHRAAACRAGLGFIGKNALFYAHGLGSYVGIASIGTDAGIEGAGAGQERVSDPACSGCSRCVAACPVSAIPAEGYRIDPLRCLSFANRHPDEPLRVLPRSGARLQRWLHGCETCQNVCPLNRPIPHRGDAVVNPDLEIEGMVAPNVATLLPRDVESKIGSVTSAGYRAYLRTLLARP